MCGEMQPQRYNNLPIFPGEHTHAHREKTEKNPNSERKKVFHTANNVMKLSRALKPFGCEYFCLLSK